MRLFSLISISCVLACSCSSSNPAGSDAGPLAEPDAGAALRCLAPSQGHTLPIARSYNVAPDASWSATLSPDSEFLVASGVMDFSSPTLSWVYFSKIRTPSTFRIRGATSGSYSVDTELLGPGDLSSVGGKAANYGVLRDAIIRKSLTRA